MMTKEEKKLLIEEKLEILKGFEIPDWDLSIKQELERVPETDNTQAYLRRLDSICYNHIMEKLA